MGIILRLVAVVVLTTTIFSGRLAAAPQILGLVATTTPVPLTCESGLCTAELSAFCLQKHRHMPLPGTAYRTVEPSALTLSVIAEDGTVRSLPAGQFVSFDSRREYNAVRVSIAEVDLLELGGGTASVTVAPRASLVPVAEPGDPAPMDAHEVAYVTGPFRKAVEGTVAEDEESAVTIGVVGRLINGLPEGWTTAEKRDTLWHRVIGNAPGADSQPGVHRAKREFEVCRIWAGTGRGEGLRRCLEEVHDQATTGFTRKAWELSETGS